ncbi:MAG: glycerol-3-phosphate 1-O-acyltransferase PlsY [Lachnospiraceae bacterium]|jgi:glycerol-3-phosphate acyltransferase PlsY|nr:glycerol-3-phosphate 1-O-acyltransferase PlsY [Lachnospiraceae bacterium]
MLARLLCIFIGYCLGLIQTSYIYGKLHGIDIRDYGSGNAGTTNALRVLGRRAGLIVLLGDFFKAAIACFIARAIAVNFYPEIIFPLVLWAGFGVIIGHNYPFYMNFKGGKGIAATAGLILGVLDIRIMITCLLAFILCVAITKYVSLGSLIVVTLLFAEFLIFGLMGNIYEPFTKSYCGHNSVIEGSIILFVLAVLAFYRHKANIVRLIHGEENKVSLGKKKDAEQEADSSTAK